MSFRWCGKILLTGSEDKSLRMWDFRTGKSTAPMDCQDEVLDCNFSPNGKQFLAACKNNVLLLWDVRERSRPYAQLTGHTDWVTCCCWSPDGSLIVSGSTDKTLKLWNPATGAAIRTFSGALEAITSCGYIGESLVSCGGNRFWESKENPVTLWNPEDESVSHTLGCHGDAVMALAVASDGARLATCSMDKTARVWQLAPPAEQAEERSRDKDSRASTARGMTRQDSVRRPARLWASPKSGDRVDCALGCGQALPRSSLEDHEARECPNRRVCCPLCGEELVAKDAAAHEREACPQRVEACACGAALRPDEAEEHRAARCPMQRRPCTLGCGTEVVSAEMAAHVASFCQEREVACVLGCGARLKARWILRHQQRDCAERRVQCALCGAGMTAREQDTHVKRHCPGQRVVCRLGCALRMAARDLQVMRPPACDTAPGTARRLGAHSVDLEK